MRMVGLVFSTVVLVSVFSASAPQLVQGQAMANPAKVADAKMALRTLYIDHIFWVRSLVISTRLGEKQAVSEADEYGLANAKAIGGSVGPFYGQAAADKFTSLFVGHYSAVKGYMSAAFANGFKGNAARRKAALDALMQNANEIAVFVSSANPNLPKATVSGFLVTHVQQHVMSIDATAKKDWSREADMWEPMVKEIYALSDALADGIAKQFPEKFQ